MRKRLCTKRSMKLTYRHYLYHFRWPLFGIICFLIFISWTKFNFISDVFSSDEYEEKFEILYTDVIYPIDIFGENNRNTSILYHFTRKDELKSIDDMKSIDKQQKIILPLIDINKSSSSSYLILEFTNVFWQPRFCSHSKEDIFGKTCPFTNW
jgi:hypothetical protein